MLRDKEISVGAGVFISGSGLCLDMEKNKDVLLIRKLQWDVCSEQDKIKQFCIGSNRSVIKWH